jgi:hypothetical protein
MRGNSWSTSSSSGNAGTWKCGDGIVISPHSSNKSPCPGRCGPGDGFLPGGWGSRSRPVNCSMCGLTGTGSRYRLTLRARHPLSGDHQPTDESHDGVLSARPTRAALNTPWLRQPPATRAAARTCRVRRRRASGGPCGCLPSPLGSAVAAPRPRACRTRARETASGCGRPG